MAKLMFYVLLCASLAVIYGKECGTRKFANTVDEWQRIIGGKDAIKGSWPWQVVIFNDGRQWCGGSLINNQWVLTAGHCIYFAYYALGLTVRLGEHNLLIKEGTEQDFEISNIFLHEAFEIIPHVRNDIALLKLEKPVNYEENDYINSICLPETNQDLVGETVVTTGWGDTDHPEATTVLQEVSITVIDQYTCNKTNIDIMPVTEEMICAGMFKGACHGDSGGPLVHKSKDGKWYVVGVTSWGSQNCGNGYPSVFTRAGYYYSWIKDKIENN